MTTTLKSVYIVAGPDVHSIFGSYEPALRMLYASVIKLDLETGCCDRYNALAKCICFPPASKTEPNDIQALLKRVKLSHLEAVFGKYKLGDMVNVMYHTAFYQLTLESLQDDFWRHT